MKNNEKGFSVLEVLLIVILFGLLGGVGWLVWNGQKDIISKQQNTSKQSNQSEYFEIKEWGVNFKSNDKLNDLYYVYVDDGNEETLATTIDFSLNALKNTDCAIDKTSQFRIARYSQAEVDKLDTSNMANVIRESTKLGGYYYPVISNGDVCSQDSSLQNKVDEFRTELMNAIPSTLQLSR